jgi:CBS domain-containing protein
MTMLSSTWMPELNPRDWFAAEQRRTTLQYLSELTDAEDVGAVRAASTCVAEVMVRGVVAAHEGARFSSLVDALARNHIGSVPVLDEQRRVVGVVSASDLLAHGYARSGDVRSATAGELMTSPAVVTRPGATVDEATRLAARHRLHLLPVVDGDGVLAGIVTRADLLRVFLHPEPKTGSEP